MATAATSTGVLSKPSIRIKDLTFAFIALMMVYVVFHNESFLWHPNDPIWQHYRAIKWYLLPHGLTAMFAIFLGPTQFSNRLRARFPKYHRVAGRFYVFGALIGGPLGAIMQAAEGPLQWTVLSVVDAIMLVTTTGIALNFILKGNVTLHRAWMTRSYAVALVFVEGRFFSGVFRMDQNDTMSLAIIWACLAMSLPIADIAIHMQDITRRRPAPKPVMAMAD